MHQPIANQRLYRRGSMERVTGGIVRTISSQSVQYFEFLHENYKILLKYILFDVTHNNC